jgi:lambda family phage portal protein
MPTIEALDLTEAKHAAIARKYSEMARKAGPVQSGARMFSAAQMGRLTFDWAMSILSRDQKLWTDLRKLRSRSRELADNDPTAAKFLSLCEANVVGKHGVRFQPKVKNLRGDGLADALNKQIKDEWRLWCAKGVCTMDGKQSFDELERLLIRTAAMDGEFLVIHKVTNANPWGYAIQRMDMDQLDHTFFLEQTTRGTEIRMGVEVDKFMRPVAYHIWNRHPNEWSARPLDRVRVPAEDVVHGFRMDSAMQTRGVPWMAPAMFQMNMLRGYMEAEVTAARVGACQMGIVMPKDGAGEYTAETRNADGSIEMEATPGGFLSLGAGQDFKEFKPEHPSTAFSPFVKEVKRGIAASLGVSYNSLAEDLEGVNFSSIRAGLLNERDMWRVRQKWLIESFHKPVFKRWLECAVLSGRINLGVRDIDSVADQCAWHPRGWPWVDPLKDQQASAMGVQNGFTTRSRLLGEQGYDLEDTLEELADEEKLIEKYGLKLGTDAKGVADAPEDAEEGSTEKSKGGGSV